MNEPLRVVRVHGTASAETACTHAHLSLTLRAWSVKTTEARKKAKRTLDLVYRALKELREQDVGLDESNLNSHFEIRPHFAEGTRHGYSASYSLELTTNKPDSIATVFDRFAEVDNVELGSPRFSVPAAIEQQLKNEAFTKAVKSAKARFSWQCAVVGLDPAAFNISRWEYGSEEEVNTGKRLRLPGPGDEISVTARAARCVARVHLTYSWLVSPFG